MLSKQFCNICVITTLICSLGMCNATINTNNNSISIKKKDNNNKKQVKKNNKKNGIITTIKNSVYEEIEKDTKARSKSQPHIASYLPANLPQQLIRCMENALKNNEQIKEAQKEILASHEDHNINRAALMPTISANTSLAESNRYNKSIEKDNNIKEPFGKSNTLQNTAGLRVEYNIFHGGSDIANLKSTDKSIEVKWKNYDATIQKVLQEVAKKYFEIVIQQEKIKNIKALLNATQESKRVSKQMVEAGTAKELDIAQADIAYLDAQSKLYDMEVNEKISRATLKQLTGVEVTEKLDAPDKIFDKKFTKEEALNIAIKNNPSIISVIAEHAAAKAKLSTFNGEFLPRIDISAGLNKEFARNKSYDAYDHTNPLNVNKTIGYAPSVSLQASLPIFNGGSSFAKKVQQAYVIAKVAVTKDKIYKEIEAGITQAIDSLESIENTIKVANQMITAQRVALESTKKEHEAGTKITKDVLEAQQKLFEAHSILTNAINNRYIYQCNLMALLGWFNPSDLKLKGLKFNYKDEYYRQIQRILPTFEEMGIDTKKHLVTNNKTKKVYNNTNNMKRAN